MGSNTKFEYLKAAENIVTKEMGFQEFLKVYYSFLPKSSLDKQETIYNFLRGTLKAVYLQGASSGSDGPSTRVRYLESRNAYLESEVLSLTSQLAKLANYESIAIGKAIQCLPELTRCALKIQSAWRGYRLRKRLPWIVIDKNKKKIEKKILTPSEEVLVAVKTALEKRNLTLENAYRACDTSNDGVVTSEELRRFIDKLNLALTKRQVLKLIEVLDENCSGNIERDEFYESLEAYGVASEDQVLEKSVFQSRILQKFIVRCEAQRSYIDLFKDLKSDNDEVCAEVLRKEIGMIGMKERESQVLIRLLDPNRTGQIKYNFFINVIEKKLPSVPRPFIPEPEKENSDLKKTSICQLGQVLKNYGLDLFGVFRFANKMNKEVISSEEFVLGLKKLVPNIGEIISIEEIVKGLPQVLNKESMQSIAEEGENEKESGYWEKRFEGLIQRRGANLQMIFLAADENKDGMATVSDLEGAMALMFDKDASAKEIEMILQTYGLDKLKSYSYKNFYNAMKLNT